MLYISVHVKGHSHLSRQFHAQFKSFESYLLENRCICSPLHAEHTRFFSNQATMCPKNNLKCSNNGLSDLHKSFDQDS